MVMLVATMVFTIVDIPKFIISCHGHWSFPKNFSLMSHDYACFYVCWFIPKLYYCRLKWILYEQVSPKLNINLGIFPWCFHDYQLDPQIYSNKHNATFNYVTKTPNICCKLCFQMTCVIVPRVQWCSHVLSIKVDNKNKKCEDPWRMKILTTNE
jgi:hypothetical protein